MRFHVISLPHTQTTKAYSTCAYTQKVRKFCIMMKSLGHEVFLYAGEENEAPCDELITCMSKKEQQKILEKLDSYVNVSFNPEEWYWKKFNERVVEALATRIEKKDFICVIAGVAHKEIADTYPAHMTVEFGIGYGGTFAKFRVFESYCWQHMVNANDHPNLTGNGNFYEAVIPNYFEPEDFPMSEVIDDYYLFIGRLIDRKGYKIAIEAAERTGKKLILAGPGDPGKLPDNVKHVGEVGPLERGRLMSRATAVMVPTIYIEPFGGVAVEAMMCGTPIITTDWGAFTEYNKAGTTGFRCRTLGEFIEAMDLVKTLDRVAIRKYATANFSLDRVRHQYEAYFEQLDSLWETGWKTWWSGLGKDRYNKF